MELLNLQSSLQSEIQAKQSIGEELSKTRSELIAMQKYDYNNIFIKKKYFPKILILDVK